MAQPIRWDNINGAGLGDAARPLEAAQRSFLGAFDTVGNVLQQRQQIEDQNWQNTRTNNTNAFLDAVAKYRSPEDVRAANAQGGALDQLRAGFGNQVDANAIRGAADAQAMKLQQQAQQDIAYNHVMTDERVAPLLDQYKQAVLKGDAAAAADAQAKYTQLGGRDLAGLAAYADSRANEVKVRGQNDLTFDLNQRKGQQDILASEAAIKNAAEQTKLARETLANQKLQTESNIKTNQFNMDRQTKLDNAAVLAGQAAALKQSLEASGNLFSNGVWTGNEEQSGAVQKALTSAGITNPDKRAKAVAVIDKLQREGVTLKALDKNGNLVEFKTHDIPFAAVMSAVNSSYDQNAWGWNRGVATSVEENLTNILQQRSNQGGKGQSKLADDLAAFKYSLKQATDNAPGIIPNRPSRGK